MFLKVGAKFVSPWSKKVMIDLILYISFSLLQSMIILLAETKKLEKEEREGK
jgi:hypothetical protein